MKQFAFIYFLTEDTDRIKKSLGEHVRYWKDCRLENFRNGPFGDKSGGMIVFSAAGQETADAIIAADPLLRAGALQKYWLKEWIT